MGCSLYASFSREFLQPVALYQLGIAKIDDANTPRTEPLVDLIKVIADVDCRKASEANGLNEDMHWEATARPDAGI